MKETRLRKLLPLVERVKDRCLELYQPVCELSIDERMVKSKARSHMIQYMNKPRSGVLSCGSLLTLQTLRVTSTSIQTKMSVVVMGFHIMSLHSW